MNQKTMPGTVDFNDDILWNLCDSYEKLTGSRTALNNFLTAAFRKQASTAHVMTALRRSIRELKAKN